MKKIIKENENSYRAIYSDKDGVKTQMFDRRTLEDCLRTGLYSVRDLNTALKNDKGLVMKSLEYSPKNLHWASKALRDDKDVVMEAVGRKDYWCDNPNMPETLKWASDRLKDDKEVVMAAIDNPNFQGSEAFEYASDKLKDNKDFVCELLKNRKSIFEYVSDRLKDDEDVVRTAAYCDRNFWLEYASDRLKDDKEIVLAAVKQNCYNLEFASDRLKNDYDFIKEAYMANPNMFNRQYDFSSTFVKESITKIHRELIEEKKPFLSSMLGKAEKASQEHNSKLNTQSRDNKDLEK